MASYYDSEKWTHLIKKANDLTKKEDYEKSLVLYREALALHHNDKLVRRIKKIEVS